MRKRSINLTDEEAAELRKLAQTTGAEESKLLKQAVLCGRRAMRLEEGMQAFQQGSGSLEATEIAGLPRAVFLQKLIDRGITILEGPSTLAEELASLADDFGSERLARVARRLAEERAGSSHSSSRSPHLG